MNRLARVSALALTIAALPVLSGCGGGNPFHPPVDNVHTLPNDTPLNDTPQNTMLRFQKAYQYQDITAYTGLLTSDFRYTFSSQSDQNLVNQYGPNWGKDDETESAKHLLNGFTNSLGTFVYPASNITISFVNDQYYPDPLHSDSTSYYVYCPVSTVNLNIDVPSGAGTTTYNISAPHSFYLVRGDAAFLDAGQSPANDRWYIRHWDDLSPAITGTAVLHIAAANSAVGGSSASSFSGTTTTKSSWGAVKDAFFR